jgi:hypothetical protein
MKNPHFTKQPTPCSRKISTERLWKIVFKTIHFPVGKEGKPSFLIRSKGFPLGIVEKGGVK